ncbi:flagellar hook length control protein FliK [Citrobacter sp. BDA59-3]|uniref:flagellar hook length control protein FliK n=1 Tax=Citrobacter sp. BDA59-3 TaxID=2781952 RepID=UPI00187EA9B8|nr:flagellar hook length control protein FliK [Citrobacter sp. BDA59-3]QOV67189.1 flagellar hook length control protein FliK [Citrobacter sp. BDA59-3]
MINLQKLLSIDVDATSGVQTGVGKTSGDTAQDFLALLAGALGGKTLTGTDAEGKTTITLADLQAASGKSLKNLRALSSDDAQSPAQKLADLLAPQTAKTDTDTLTSDSKTQVQTLLSGLTPETKSSVLAALGKTNTTTDTTIKSATDDDSSDLNEEELAGLSALMAMLPHQQTAQLAPTKSTADVSTAANSALGATKRSGVDLASLTAGAQKGDNANTALHVTTPSASDDTAQQQAGIFGSALAPAAKQDADNATMTINTTASIAPVISNASSAQASAPISSAVLSAPLGSSEWQQTLSQHVTMFTRQGQQSAELHLHPEDLGQVQISLKLDDNLAQIQMVSPHSHVRQALEAALPTLRTSLAENGIQLGQSSISSESFAGQQQSFSQQQQSSRTGGGSNLAAEEDESLIVPASLQSAARGNSAVDIFA